MIITCDAFCNMGYIYLQPPSKDKVDYHSKKDNSIAKYVDISSITMPLEIDTHKGNLLNNMRLSHVTYKKAVGNEFEDEYRNDLDKNGYIIGIELSLSKDRFVNLITNGAYKIIQTEWKGLHYHITTFDYDKVFDSRNVIYPLSVTNDAYLIVEITSKDKTGFIKALITARDDLYPIDYLLNPQFILSEYTLG
ncbi:hypothetical protein [Brevibacillus choshinensis]|uniref:hypothetical protein n=1 Tax=Brevibacillus choshinensis TaxID=54911 RepID=UPI002E2290F9|nr:hypothetical protein [Brevibacillus choshinensis]